MKENLKKLLTYLFRRKKVLLPGNDGWNFKIKI